MGQNNIIPNEPIWSIGSDAGIDLIVETWNMNNAEQETSAWALPEQDLEAVIVST